MQKMEVFRLTMLTKLSTIKRSLFKDLNSRTEILTYCTTTDDEGREGGGVTIPFPTRNFSKIPVPVEFLLKIPVEVIKIPVNKK